MGYVIREIEECDNSSIEDVIRSCLIEFGANHDGTAWADPELCHLCEAYCEDGNKYWVIEDEDGKICGGAGIGKLRGADKICELQKMYCLPEIRGTGLASQLMRIALEYAKQYYKKCYIETLENMTRAQKFYEKCGFVRIYHPVVETEHFACDVRFIKEL